MRRRLTIVSFAVVGCCAAVISVASVLPDSGTAGAASPERRPDLVQRTPTGIGVLESDGRFLLGFDSAVENHGRGPLLVQGHRTAIQQDMTADQLIRRANGSLRRVRGIGVIRYTRSGGHDHWHYLKAVRYELRRLSDHALVRPDHKTGFCLGDRYDAGRAFAGKPRRPIYNTNCRLYQPAARSVEMGISVGYGDDYRAYLEGQSIDITGVPGGRYTLVHRANPARRLAETDLSNNASSVLMRIAWPRGGSALPAVSVLKRCPRRERCVP